MFTASRASGLCHALQIFRAVRSLFTTVFAETRAKVTHTYARSLHFFTSKDYAKAKTLVVPKEEASVIIEAWHYPPLLPNRNKMDTLSIWLTTREIADDERVQGERENMMEAFQW